ncbi:hypothetical protein ACGYLM_01510 [Sulfitobacter sp. 1A10445]|uniref:hypothetical protein n=1 Tax=unclassified Sulfitobacter TaxID=196795 RepID=UPI003746446B
MSEFNKFNAFTEDVAEKKHNLGSDQIKVALTNTAPVAGNSVLADLTEITYTNLSARDVTTASSGQTGGEYKLTLTDLTLTASGGSVGPFRYVVLYNDTASGDPLIGWYDRGASITLLDGESILIDFDDADGVLTIT